MVLRPTIIAGNWKMHKTLGEAVKFIDEFVPLIDGVQSEIYLAVPFTCLAVVAEKVCDVENIEVGAQNMNDHEDGPWTGEISGRLLKEAGADFVVLEHSERRQHYAETNAVVNQKVKLAFGIDLQPLVCVGETLQQRESGREHEIIEAQLVESLAGISKNDAQHLIIAYEPVWAIGTGKNATPQLLSQFIALQAVLGEIWDKATADKIPILYGGGKTGKSSRYWLSPILMEC